MLESIFGNMLNYYLWLFALTLSFSSSILFFKLYLRSRGTPLGKVAFYISLNSLLWSIALAVLSVPSMTMVGIYTDIFLLATFIAGISSIVGAYYRAIIQGLLTPTGEEEPQNLRVYLMLCGLSLAVAVISAILFAFGVPFATQAMNGQSILGEIGIIFIVLALILQVRPKRFYKLAYLGILVALILGVIVLIGNWLLIRFLLNPFNSGFTSDLTAVGLISASFYAILCMRPGLRARTAEFIPATATLLIAVLALVGYVINLPILYNGGVYVGLPPQTLICFVLIGFAMLWYSWTKS